MARLLSSKEVASMLGVTDDTVRRWRSLGEGPRWIKVGGSVRYRPSEVESWLDEKTSDRQAEA